LRPAQANSLQDPISKIGRAKWTGVFVQAIEYLLCKHKDLSSNPNPTLKKKKVLSAGGFVYFTICTAVSLLWGKS
jgi:hypothetical protein